MNRIHRIGQACLLALALHPLSLVSAEDVQRVSIPLLQGALPPDGEGDCFARVEVPASYGYERVELPIRSPTARFQIEPARFELATHTITLSPAHDVLTLSDARYDSETHRIERPDTGPRWVRGALDGDRPPSVQDMAALKASGIRPDRVEPGQCVIEYYKPGKTIAASRRVMVHEADEVLSIEAAQFAPERHEIVLAPAHGRLVEIPAVWRDDEAEVITESARIDWEAANLDEATADGQDEDATLVLRRVNVPAQTQRVPIRRIETPAMITRIEQAATTETVDVQRLVRDARVVREPLAARYRTIDLPVRVEPGDYRWTLQGDAVEAGLEPTDRRLCLREAESNAVEYERTVVREPARVTAKRVPAITEERAVQRLVADASYVRTEVPAVTRRLTRRTLQAPAHQAWQPVVCEADLSPALVERVQRGLLDAGHSPNGVDGLMGPGTRRALQAFQSEAGLATGALTLQSLDRLGIATDPASAPDAQRVVELNEEP